MLNGPDRLQLGVLDAELCLLAFDVEGAIVTKRLSERMPLIESDPAHVIPRWECLLSR